MKSTYVVIAFGTLALITLAQSTLVTAQNKTTKNITAGVGVGNFITGTMKNTTINGNTSTNSNVTAASGNNGHIYRGGAAAGSGGE